MSNRDGPRHWLGIYLNDHLASATAGAELARRVAGSHQDPEHRKRLLGLAADIAADRQALLQLMRGAGVPVRGYKILAGWAAEKATRLKTSANFLTRSPLSDLTELETLYLGIQGKAAGWRALLGAAGNDGLLGAAGNDGLLDQQRLRVLLHRTGDQLAVVEELRIQVGAGLFSLG
jgi:hypothetical protein